MLSAYCTWLQMFFPFIGENLLYLTVNIYLPGIEGLWHPRLNTCCTWHGFLLNLSLNACSIWQWLFTVPATDYRQLKETDRQVLLAITSLPSTNAAEPLSSASTLFLARASCIWSQWQLPVLYLKGTHPFQLSVQLLQWVELLPHRYRCPLLTPYLLISLLSKNRWNIVLKILRFEIPIIPSKNYHRLGENNYFLSGMVGALCWDKCSIALGTSDRGNVHKNFVSCLLFFQNLFWKNLVLIVISLLFLKPQ